ncbi:UDP-galactopyranose mutase [Celerinatantimonas sp. YJH-8]|uniref:UDP-galactopyranose mutase n=1 Tax=Celerinatantimonas sp. YJH-8 TaxID=3228714 RepID=UPI0038C287D1
MSQWDFLIVGSGLYGAVCAQQLSSRGYRVKVIEQRDHIAGNIYTENKEGIAIHRYGAHIFHTSDAAIWDYVQQFAQFNRFTNSPLANFRGKLYNLPFNMHTFYQLWGVTTPQQALHKLEQQRAEMQGKTPTNLEEQALALVGRDIYETLIKGYSEKQWGRPACELPAFIIRRLPLRFTFDNNYFSDHFQGIPVDGYTALVQNMLEGIDVSLNCDFFDASSQWALQAKHIIYTGPIDRYFGYQLGHLGYRSLRFDLKRFDTANVQGNAVINYTDPETPYTRTIEHKHFAQVSTSHSYLTYEYPQAWQPGTEPYYPINDEPNMALYKRYRELARALPQVHFGGRLGQYRYFDMHQVIAAALHYCQQFTAVSRY